MGGFGSASNMALGARIMGGGGRSQMASPHSLASTGEDLPAAQTLPTFSGLPRLHPLEALGGPRSGSSALTSSPASPIGQHSKEHRLSSRKEPAGGSGMPDPHQAHDLGSSRADLAPDDHSQHPRHASPAQPLSVSNGSRDSLYAPLQARPSPRRSRQESPGQLDSTSNPALDDGPWSRESPGNPTASAAVDWLENVNNQWREMEAGSKPFRHPMITNDRQAGVAGSKGSRHSVRLPDRTDNVQPSMEDFAALSGRATRANKNREGHGDAVRDSDSPRSLRADSISGTQNGSELPGSGWSVSNQVPGGFGQQILEQQPGMEIINGRASTTSLLA